MHRTLAFVALLGLTHEALGFYSAAPGTTTTHFSTTTTTTTTTTRLQATNTNKKCTPLPNGLSPFEKSLSKSLDLQGSFRKLAGNALQQALRTGVTRCELEFPPLLGGDLAKTQFGTYMRMLIEFLDWMDDGAACTKKKRKIV